MDIYYSIAAANLVFKRPLTSDENDAVVAELVMFGNQMGIPNLPRNYSELCKMRQHRFADYGVSEFTNQLLTAYRTALGFVGYRSLLATYPVLLEPELWAKMPLRFQPLSPILKFSLPKLCRTGLIKFVYRVGLPTRLNDVVGTWQDSCLEQSTTNHDS
jgi:hypothetical protein